jgi:hypothetical protein
MPRRRSATCGQDSTNVPGRSWKRTSLIPSTCFLPLVLCKRRLEPLLLGQIPRPCHAISCGPFVSLEKCYREKLASNEPPLPFQHISFSLFIGRDRVFGTHRLSKETLNSIHSGPGRSF